MLLRVRTYRVEIVSLLMRGNAGAMTRSRLIRAASFFLTVQPQLPQYTHAYVR